MKQCMNTTKLIVKRGKTEVVVCKEPATTYRKTFRWGQKGEPAIVNFRWYMCNSCALQADDNRAEMIGEGRVS